MKKIAIFIILSLCFFACENVEKKINGSWIIEQAYIYNAPVIWNLTLNCFLIENNYNCILPVADVSLFDSEERVGTWKVLKEKKKYYLVIDTKNELFNRKFEIQNLRKGKDERTGGYFVKMSLAADSIKFDCMRAVYDY